MDAFNLVDKSWIPAMYASGRFRKIGIREAMEDAGAIRQIAAPNPMDRVALLRFLLAILYWCKGSPPEQRDNDRVLNERRFPSDWFEKLDRKKDCFNLLGDGSRFYQDPGACRTRATTDLLQEVPTGNNFWHFRHSIDKADGLCRACCAKGLLRLPLFSVSGLPNLKAGINGAPPVYVVPLGTSLLDTLCQNWISCSSVGKPAWDSCGVLESGSDTVPLLKGLTTLSRRVWLDGNELTDGCCVGCGDREAEILRTCEYESAGRQENPHWDDPHVLYLQKTAKNGKSFRKPLTAPDLTKSSFRMDKPWPAILRELCAPGRIRPAVQPLSLLIVGFATEQAKYIDVWERVCVVPANQGSAHDAVEQIKKWNDEGGKLPQRMKPKGSKSRAVEFVAAVAAIRPQVEAQVSSNIAAILNDPAQSFVQCADAYRPMLASVAGSLAPGFTASALRRRNEIAASLPNMARAQSASQKQPPKEGVGG